MPWDKKEKRTKSIRSRRECKTNNCVEAEIISSLDSTIAILDLYTKEVNSGEQIESDIVSPLMVLLESESGLAAEKGDREQGERNLQDKMKEIESRIETHENEHKNIKDLIVQQRGETDRRFSDEADKATTRFQDMLKKIDVLYIFKFFMSTS